MQTRQVTLRPTEQADLAVLFHVQQNPEAIYQAAFTPENHSDQAAYVAKFTRFLQDPTIHTHTIWVGETIVGSVAKYEAAGQAEVTYWLDRAYWSQGIATMALTTLLTLEKTRPIFGRVAFDNVGSQRVLEKCGFVQVGTDKGFAHARQREIEEFIYKLP